MLAFSAQVNNNCSTGSTALFMAKQFVEGGVSNCVLALGKCAVRRN
jgi:acetyl-CoA acetyltransferase